MQQHILPLRDLLGGGVAEASPTTRQTTAMQDVPGTLSTHTMSGQAAPASTCTHATLHAFLSRVCSSMRIILSSRPSRHRALKQFHLPVLLINLLLYTLKPARKISTKHNRVPTVPPYQTRLTSRRPRSAKKPRDKLTSTKNLKFNAMDRMWRRRISSALPTSHFRFLLFDACHRPSKRF